MTRDLPHRAPPLHVPLATVGRWPAERDHSPQAQEEGSPLPPGILEWKRQVDFGVRIGAITVIFHPVEQVERTRIAALTVGCEDESSLGEVQPVCRNDIVWPQTHKDLSLRGCRNVLVPVLPQERQESLHVGVGRRPRRRLEAAAVVHASHLVQNVVSTVLHLCEEALQGALVDGLVLSTRLRSEHQPRVAGCATLHMTAHALRLDDRRDRPPKRIVHRFLPRAPLRTPPRRRRQVRQVAGRASEETHRHHGRSGRHRHLPLPRAVSEGAVESFAAVLELPRRDRARSARLERTGPPPPRRGRLRRPRPPHPLPPPDHPD